MKDRYVRFSAMLLVLWYCFSVIGFNVHTCKASGRSFVATFVSGLTCADIHPGHVCDKEMCGNGHSKVCCGHHDEDGAHHECLRPAGCCSDDHVALTITGCAFEDNHRPQDDLSCLACVSCGPADVSLSRLHTFGSKFSRLFRHDPWLIVTGDLRSLLNIWRI